MVSARARDGRRVINRRARAVPGLVRARVGLLINRRFTVHAASDVPNKKFSKNQRVLPVSYTHLTLPTIYSV